MKYVYGMVEIWKNMVVGRSKLPLFMIILVALITSINVIYQGGLLGGFIFSISLWVFGLPSAIYLIDQDTKINPTRPKSPRNLFRALTRK